jgi:transposase InsO family protein
MCAWLKINRSGYYDWKTRDVCQTVKRNQTLAVVARACFDASDATYGYRRVHADLIEAGYQVCDQTVRRLMRAQGLVPCQVKARKPVTTIAGDAHLIPDLVGRKFTAERPGTKWFGDITYIPTNEGFAYLATVLDACSKKVVGYAVDNHMRADLTEEALRMAARNCPWRAAKAIFHTDRGSVYTSQQMAKVTHDLDILRSMGKTGVCFDNAWAESFNGALKVERVHRRTYETHEEAIRDVANYIELFYNQKRRHSALGYATPNQVEHAWIVEQSHSRK